MEALVSNNRPDLFKRMGLSLSTGNQDFAKLLLIENLCVIFRSFTKNRMVAKPTPGDFWQADHRIAVVEGGGQCDIGNFRTLCTVCHAQETKALMERVRKQKKLEKASSCAAGTADLRKFYKPI